MNEIIELLKQPEVYTAIITVVLSLATYIAGKTKNTWDDGIVNMIKDAFSKKPKTDANGNVIKRGPEAE